MAVLALAFVGSAIGASIGGTVLGATAATIGGFVGSAIGSMVDNMLFPQSQQGPRLSDLSVQVSSYGQIIPRIYGPENRIAGNVIWSSGLLETKHTHTEGGKGGPSVKVTEYTYRTCVAVLLGEGGLGPIVGIRKIWANAKLIYDKTGGADTHAIFDTVTVYPGSFTQMPDPTVEAYKGIGNAPAYRGSAYVVIKDLQLADFGNRLPNLEFLVEAQDSITVGACCRNIAERCGIDSNTISVSAANDTIRGYIISQNASGTAALQPLALAYDFDVADVCGALRLVSRKSGMLAAIPLDLLAGHADQDERPEAITWTRAPETALPREAAVTFSDPGMDYQPNTQVARREAGYANNNLSTEIALTLDADEGRRIADRTLWEAWTARQLATTTSDDRLWFVECGRRYAFETPAGWEILRITRKSRGANGVIEFDLRRDQGQLYTSRAPGARGAIPVQQVAISGPSELILLDIPILLDADDGPGFYYAVVAPAGGWRGADVMRALAPGEDFGEVAPMGFEATVGTIAGTVPAGPTIGFDDASVITVNLRRTDMILTSVTDDAMGDGTNACFIGNKASTGQGEIVQFGTATMTAPGQYELSHLLRGRKGTEFAVSVHGPNETFVLLERGVVKRASFGTADLNQARAFKAVSLLTSPDDAATVTFTNTGAGLRPYAPTNLAMTGAPAADKILTWTRRSRLESGALGETSEAYLLRILTAGGAVRRQASLAAPMFTYTIAMQTADFGAPVSTMRFQVAQVSSVYGTGIFAGYG